MTVNQQLAAEQREQERLSTTTDRQLQRLKTEYRCDTESARDIWLYRALGHSVSEALEMAGVEYFA